MKKNKKKFKIPFFKKKGLDFNRHRGRRDYTRAKAGLILFSEIVGAVALAFIVAYTFFCSVFVSGVSMEPTLNSGNRVLINRLSTVISLKRGSVIAFESGSGHSKIVNIKRVVGLPGDVVLIENGMLYINGQREETVRDYAPMNEAGIAKKDYIIPAGEYFLLGDNRNNSEDSRFETVGTINKSDILGKIWICMSLSNFGPVQ